MLRLDLLYHLLSGVVIHTNLTPDVGAPVEALPEPEVESVTTHRDHNTKYETVKVAGTQSDETRDHIVKFGQEQETALLSDFWAKPVGWNFNEEIGIDAIRKLLDAKPVTDARPCFLSHVRNRETRLYENTATGAASVLIPLETFSAVLEEAYRTIEKSFKMAQKSEK